MSRFDYDYVDSLYRSLQAEYAERNADYDIARKRVDGVLWGDSTNPTPRNRYSLSANYLLPIVMKHVQLLMGRLPAIQVMPRGVDEDDRRHAEKLEGVLYGIWNASNASDVFQTAAWDSYVLRRGIITYWWDTKAHQARFKHINPDDFYARYDSGEIFECTYAYRRHVEALRFEYPDKAAGIESNPPTHTAQIYGQTQPHLNNTDYVTVIDYYNRDGQHTRVANDLVLEDMNLAHPEGGVPFVEFPCYPANGNREPSNGIDQIIELVQYLSQLVSQKADVIRTYANPTILDKASGQSPEAIRRAVAADGSVLPIHRDGSLEFLNWSGTMPAIEDQVELVRDLIFDLSGKPRSAFGQTITNQSGVVTNLALTPTLQSNEYHETQWGKALSFLNRRLLQLTEKFGAAYKTTYRGYRPIGADMNKAKTTNLEFQGSEIQQWYENRIKWPSAIRTDDPVFIQNIVTQLTSDPPAISLYTALELLGHEDVEAEIDRIEQQLQDPRMHPDRLQAGQDAALAAGNGALAGRLMGGGAGGPLPPDNQTQMTGALEASGNPNKNALA